MSSIHSALQHNPLGIRSMDGNDIVMGKTKRYTVTSIELDEEQTMSKAMSANQAYYTSESQDTSLTSELELNSLSISAGSKHSDGARASTDLSQVHLDFGDSFSVPTLSRKDTIKAQRIPSSSSTMNVAQLNTQSGPSTNPMLIQRLKSIRRKLSGSDVPRFDEEDDYFQRAGELPSDVLRMIAFNSDSPWLEMEDFEANSQINYSATEQIDARPTQEENQAQLEASTRDSTTPNELNPFYVAKTGHAALESDSSLASGNCSISEGTSLHSPIEPIITDNSLEARSKEDKLISHVNRQSLTIEQTDPVKEDDRGRLFLQINKITNLSGLPLDMSRNPKFTLSLDNGLQTVITDPSPLMAPEFNGRSQARIGQEYELTVAKDLELVLTVAVSMDAIKPPPRPSAPTRQFKHDASDSTSSTVSLDSFGGNGSPIKSMKKFLLRSPKKKQQQKFQQQEQYDKRVKLQQEENERERVQHERDLIEFYRRSDLWNGIIGSKGEYCRGYVFESHYEKEIYGKAKSFTVPLYNEWDKASEGVPRPVCELQITMLYIPKLYASEKIPMSLAECQKAIEHSKTKINAICEGFLTQQGGDCDGIWRRRWFTLKGNELIGHHEATKKRRALIHLDNALAVHDTLNEDLWCIYEDRSFQISFNNGENIGFYADSIEQRDMWIKSLRENVASSTGKHRSWIDLILERC